MSSDADWQDPLSGEDEAARAREARRAEREERRRGRQADISERVREEMAAAPAAATAEAPQASTRAPSVERPAVQQTDAQPPVSREDSAVTALETDERASVTPTDDRPAVPPTVPPTDDRPATPSPGGRPPRSVVARRRLGALLGIAALAFVALVVVVAAQRLGGNEAPPAPPPKERKTFSITIPEGFSRDQVAGVVKKAGIKGDYMKATESVKGFDPGRYGAKGVRNLEGFLFPATYELYENAKVDELVAKQLEAFGQNIQSIDLSYAKSKNLTTYDVVKIASMIEREVQVPAERANVSSVIYNRLANGMPLGIDATIRFEDSNYDEQLLESRLAEDTPYNTRLHAGLPPGPIGNPGLASLEAAANPAKNDLLFFVVKPGSCNEHVFTETEEEFFAAEAEYQAALQAQGNSPTEC